jgi:cytidylate kinase
MTDSAPTAARIVAVDGPAAAGKTTTAVELAARYGLRYLESGLAYRLMAYLALRYQVRLDNEKALVGLYQRFFGTPDTRADMFHESSRYGALLRDPQVDHAVSKVASMPALRREITQLIRSWAAAGQGSCVEGRDIGTTVFPSATVKFFLTAAPEVRARRRTAERKNDSYERILADVLRRDEADERRATSPLVPATDSVVIDTSGLTVDQVVTTMLTECRQAGFGPPHQRVTAHAH